MRRTVLILVLAALTTPAAAQLTRPGPPAPQPRLPTVRSDQRLPNLETWRDVGEVRRQVERGRDAGTLTKREGRRYRREADQIGTLAERYGSDGVSDAEAAELRLRAGVLRDQVNRDRLRGPQR